MISYDYSLDTMNYDGKTFELKPYREWLLKNHESLCTGHFVKAIVSEGKIKFTYDWQTIYHRSFVYEFIKDYERTITQTSATDSLSVESTESE